VTQSVDQAVLVAIAAHADDAELNAGGTLAKWVAGGGRVRLVMVTNNCSGYLIPDDGDESRMQRLGPAQTTAIRRREQQAAAALLDAEVVDLGFCQRHYWDADRQCAVEIGYEHPVSPPPELRDCPQVLYACHQQRHVDHLADLLTALRPQVIVTHGPLDYDPEHHAVASLVCRAVQTGRPDLGHATLRFWTPGSSCPEGMVPVEYDHIEDISDHFDRKLALCACHASQMTTAREEMVRRRAERWGQRMGVRYAEPFVTAGVAVDRRVAR